MTPIRIAVDAMGGDQGLDLVMPAIVQSMQLNPSVHYILVGDESGIRSRLSQSLQDHPNLEIVHAEEVVGMDEPPASALRKKKKSSMRLAINQVKEGRACACVSAGNTGALMATARFVLKTLPGIDRPAIVSGFPSETDHITYMLDLGANVDSTPEQLYQFAVMGSMMVSAINKKPSPRVALLNVGEEDIKGNEVIKVAAGLLSAEKELNYIGYVEGDRLFRDEADVLVCDGFVGNVSLKTAEGVSHFIKSQLRAVIMDNWRTKLMALICKPLFMRARKRLDPDRYNGACFLGLNGVVIKSHGGTSVRGFRFALQEAIKQAQVDVPALLRDKVAGILNRES
jgi:glycerol-3-phosphate acyltransferase PlsX